MPDRQNPQSRDEPGTQSDNLIGSTLRDGEYRILRILGHGGMGKVYLATHTSLATKFAIKQARADQPLPGCVTAELDAILRGNRPETPHPDELEAEGDFPTSGGIHTDRFLREALLLARLEHPAIPTLYDYFAQDSYWYLVMDYVPGPTLSAYLRQQPALPLLEALNYAMQLCDVLDYLHRQTPPIVFRDMKPSNIILTPEKALMLVDFGISRYFKVGQVNDTIEFGSPGYAPPEQYQGHAQTDARSDLYSLGVLLHEMVTGKRPAGMGAPLSPPQHIKPDLSASISGLIALATRSEPMYRFQSAQALYLALERVYTIEEWRAYQQQMLASHTDEKISVTAHSHAGVKFEQAAQRDNDQNREDNRQTLHLEIPSRPTGSPPPSQPQISPWSVNLHQRHAVRRTIQQVRLERLEQPHIEPQQAAREEITHHSASQPLANEQPVKQTPSRPPTTRAERVIQLCFALAMVVFLALSSVFTFIHLRQPSNANKVQQAALNNLPGLWKALPSLPEPEADNAAAYVQVKGRPYIYLNGGYRSRKQPSHYDHNLYRYDILGAHWEIINSHLPGMLNNAIAVDNQGHIFFTAGYSTDSYSVVSALYMYQPTNNSIRKITPPMPLGYGGSMLFDGQGHLYITQGFIQAGLPDTLADTGWYRYNITNDRWEHLAPLPQGLAYTQLAFDNKGGILLLGGSSDAGQHAQNNQIYRYDIAYNRWKRQDGTAPSLLSGAASCIVRPNQMIIVGGYDARHNQGLNQTWLLNLDTLHWTPLAPIPGDGSALGAIACDGRGNAFVERGAAKLNQPTQDFFSVSSSGS